MNSLPLRLRLYLIAVWATAGGLIGLLLYRYTPADGARDLAAALIVGLLVGLARAYPVQLGPNHTMLADTSAVIVALLILPAPLAALACAAGCSGIGIWQRRPLAESGFNAAVLGLSGALGALSLHLAVGFPLSSAPPLTATTTPLISMVVIGSVTFYLLQSLLIALAVGLRRGQNPFKQWLATQRRKLPHEFALCLIGLFAAVAAHQQFWLLLLVMIPAAIVYRSLRDGIALRVQSKETLESLADIVDMRDHYTFEHSRRVAEWSRALASAMRLPAEQIEMVHLAARVHDVGKIGIKSQALFKQGKLTDEDWLEMRNHPGIGAKLTERFPDFGSTRDLILHHHERYDGGGYPLGLVGEEIPLGARIIAVADAYDAMTTNRAYRRPLSPDEVLRQFREGRGTQFDPDVAAIFLDLIEPCLRSGAPGGSPEPVAAPLAAKR